jgi:hypothetical protein
MKRAFANLLLIFIVVGMLSQVQTPLYLNYNFVVAGLPWILSMYVCKNTYSYLFVLRCLLCKLQLTLFQFFLQFLGDSTYRWEVRRMHNH